MASLSNIIKINFYTLIFWLLAFLFLFPYVMTVAPILEGTINPILSDQKVNIIHRTDAEIKYEVQFYKNRDCKLETLEWISVKNNKVYAMSVVDVNNKNISGRPNRDVGLHYSNLFIAELPLSSRPPDYIKGIAYYSCHFFYFIKQDFGVIKLTDV